MIGMDGSCKKCGTIWWWPMWRANRGSKVLGHNVEMVPSESEKWSQALSRARKNESGDINSVKNGERPKWRVNQGNKVSGKNVEIVPSESEKWSQASSRARKNESGDIKNAKKWRVVKVARKPRRLLGSKKWSKNNFEKMMQWSDHCEGLDVLVPMVETVRKTDSVWVWNGQTRKGSMGYK